MKPIRALLYALARLRRRCRGFDPYRTTVILARASLNIPEVLEQLKVAHTAYTHRDGPIPEPALPRAERKHPAVVWDPPRARAAG